MFVAIENPTSRVQTTFPGKYFTLWKLPHPGRLTYSSPIKSPMKIKGKNDLPTKPPTKVMKTSRSSSGGVLREVTKYHSQHGGGVSSFHAGEGQKTFHLRCVDVS